MCEVSFKQLGDVMCEDGHLDDRRWKVVALTVTAVEVMPLFSGILIKWLWASSRIKKPWCGYLHWKLGISHC
ncbi:hypothetical protein L2E82_42039 [Cichorium intybus]|uniref:Uncharacterized protein n=1 Tax=Cichorium intybus TaxID=13427 RepID=A0ACB8ZLK9_CICIN|nr:hypothetical protein L2E82_42039 [Cichorium intybus]